MKILILISILFSPLAFSQPDVLVKMLDSVEMLERSDYHKNPAGLQERHAKAVHAQAVVLNYAGERLPDIEEVQRRLNRSRELFPSQRVEYRFEQAMKSWTPRPLDLDFDEVKIVRQLRAISARARNYAGEDLLRAEEIGSGEYISRKTLSDLISRADPSTRESLVRLQTEYRALLDIPEGTYLENYVIRESHVTATREADFILKNQAKTLGLSREFQAAKGALDLDSQIRFLEMPLWDEVEELQRSVLRSGKLRMNAATDLDADLKRGLAGFFRRPVHGQTAERVLRRSSIHEHVRSSAPKRMLRALGVVAPGLAIAPLLWQARQARTQGRTSRITSPTAGPATTLRQQ